MAIEPGDSQIYQFGPFQLISAERLLTRDGRPVALTPKSFDLLVYLVARQGRLCEKQSLLSAIWPDAIVEETNLTYNISALRKLLDGGADDSSMIQTVPTKGYRFVAPVTVSPRPTSSTPASSSAWSLTEQLARHWAMSSAAVLAAAAIAAATWMSFGGRRTASAVTTHEPVMVRLTANPLERSVTSARMSPDGRYLAYADPSGIQVRVIDTGETQPIPDTRGMGVYAWTSDSTTVRASLCTGGTCAGWDVSVFGGSRRRSGAAWPENEVIRATPDGSRLLWVTQAGELMVDLLNGTPPRALVRGAGVSTANWNADGSRVFFVSGGGTTLQSLAVEGGPATTVHAGGNDLEVASLIALSSGRVLAAMRRPGRMVQPSSARESSIWELHVSREGQADAPAVRLTDWRTDTIEFANASVDGRRLAFLSTVEQLDVYIAAFDPRVGLLDTPRRFTLDERDDMAFAWTRDNGTVLFTSGRNGTLDIFKQRLDTDVPEPVVVAAGDQVMPQVAGAGEWVLYHERVGPNRIRIMRVPTSGGNPEPLFAIGAGICHCSTSGKCVVLDLRQGVWVVSAVDPVHGKQGEVCRIPLGSEGATLLPDGNALAFLVRADTEPRNRIRIVSFTGEAPRDIVVQGAANLVNLDGLPDGKGYFSNDVTNGRSAWLFIKPDGTSQRLWPEAALNAGPIIPSWDARHLAINAWASHSNVWMLTTSP